MSSSDVEENYAVIRSAMAAVLGHGIDTSYALTSLRNRDTRDQNAKLIFAKLLAHALSLRRLSPTGLRNAKDGTAEVWDVASACCICRALIEAFDALSYVALEEVSETEREFRILLWKLHAEDRRLQSLELLGVTSPQVQEVRQEVEACRMQLATHPFLLQSEPALRKFVLGKKIPPFHFLAPERNRRSGVNHAYYTAAHILLSAHTHTYPMSIQQLAAFKAGELESLRFMSVPSQYGLGFLSKAILGIHQLFAGSVPLPSDDAAEAMRAWSEVVQNGHTYAPQ
jgi:hypothetical protein